MHKKLEAELVSLAHSILQMKNKDDVNALHKKAHDIYEKLSVLKFVDNYLQTTPNTTENKEDIIDRIKDAEKEPEVEIIEDEEPVEEVEDTDEVIEEPKVELPEEVVQQEEEIVDEDISEEAATNEISIELEMSSEEEKERESDELTEPEKGSETLFQTSLEEELKDAISADEATDLFERATKEDPVIESGQNEQKRSLNDSLFKHNLQIGLNDRIAFVKNLFDGSQEDFNRVVSQLNSFKTEKEAITFISKHVKPDYNWTDMEAYEERFMDIIERKFL